MELFFDVLLSLIRMNISSSCFSYSYSFDIFSKISFVVLNLSSKFVMLREEKLYLRIISENVEEGNNLPILQKDEET